MRMLSLDTNAIGEGATSGVYNITEALTTKSIPMVKIRNPAWSISTKVVVKREAEGGCKVQMTSLQQMERKMKTNF